MGVSEPRIGGFTFFGGSGSGMFLSRPGSPDSELAGGFKHCLRTVGAGIIANILVPCSQYSQISHT